MACSGGPDGISDGLVLALDAANKVSYPGTGTTWYDLSGNGNDVYASTTISLAKFGNTTAFNFDAVGKYFGRGPYYGSSNFINSPSTNATLEAWIYPAAAELSVGDRGTIILNTGTNGLYMSWNKSTQQLSNYWYGHPTEGYWENAAASSRSTWNHWCSVWNNADGKIYQYTNGVKSATDGSSVGNANAGVNIIIGREADSRQFAGGIAIIKIYNIPLTSAQVFQNYSDTKTRFGILS
jgi:hypothetical protein